MTDQDSGKVVRLNPVVPALPNDPRVEWCFALAEDLRGLVPPARIKLLVLQLASSEVGFLTVQQADAVLSSLGIRRE